MKQTQIFKDDGTPYLTKDGTPIYDNVLEIGDKFVPKINTPIVKEGKFASYVIPVSIITKDGVTMDDVFIKLTPTQAETIKTTEDATQKMFSTYSYANDYGVFVGVTSNVFKEPKKITDFINPDKK